MPTDCSPTACRIASVSRVQPCNSLPALTHDHAALEHLGQAHLQAGGEGAGQGRERQRHVSGGGRRASRALLLVCGCWRCAARKQAPCGRAAARPWPALGSLAARRRRLLARGRTGGAAGGRAQLGRCCQRVCIAPTSAGARRELAGAGGRLSNQQLRWGPLASCMRLAAPPTRLDGLRAALRLSHRCVCEARLVGALGGGWLAGQRSGMWAADEAGVGGRSACVSGRVAGRPEEARAAATALPASKARRRERRPTTNGGRPQPVQPAAFHPHRLSCAAPSAGCRPQAARRLRRCVARLPAV